MAGMLVPVAATLFSLLVTAFVIAHRVKISDLVFSVITVDDTLAATLKFFDNLHISSLPLRLADNSDISMTDAIIYAPLTILLLLL